MVTLALALLLALPAAPAAGGDEVRAALSALEQAGKGGVTAARFAALERLAGFDDPRCVDALLELLEQGEPAMAPTVRRVLGGYASAPALQRLAREGLGHRSPAVRAQVLVALGDGRPPGLDWLPAARAALGDAEPRVRAAAVYALGRARDAAAIGGLVEAAEDRAERVRQEAPGALARVAGVRSLATLARLLEDARWRVRLAAARALADLREPQAVALLVERLAAEPGRLREDLLALLQRLTARDFGLDVQAWRDFVRDAPPDFLKAGDEAALARLQPPRYVTGALRYYGVSTLSRSFMLLTDTSGSMASALPVRYATDAPRPRLRVAQDELLRLLGTLSAAESFDLVAFSDRARAWRGRLVPAEPQAVRAAGREIEGWRADGGTDVHGALELALAAAERALDAEGPVADDADTLFLLTDGQPSAGAVRDAALLLEHVAERNRVLQLRIHCVSLAGEGESRAFLQRLAQLGTGHYTELSEAP